MSIPALAITRRTRSTPFSSRIEKFGVEAYTIYNHMLLPTRFRGVEEDYFHLRESVQIWDVSCQRQVEIVGPDAARLAQMLTVRDLRKLGIGKCALAPVCDEDGFLLNDPVAIRVAEDRFWFSISDLDILLWAQGIALGMKLDVKIFEPNIWPLAVQGPRAEDVIVEVFGEAARATKFFRFDTLTFGNHPFLVARSGWSAQGGFEIYVDDAEIGVQLYDALDAAGQKYGIRPGCPNLIERIEAGLMTYGTDITRNDTPLEGGMAQYVGLDADIEAIGLDAIRARAKKGIDRAIVGITIDGDKVPANRAPWPVIAGGKQIGSVTSAVWSPRLDTNVSLGQVAIDFTAVGTQMSVETPDGMRSAQVSPVPFPGATTK
jgi:dimethylsulfoniopropionate demethylase